jgi:hypothetical protein
LKDRRTDEHYGIERTAAFDLGWDGNSVKGDSCALTACPPKETEPERFYPFRPWQ